MYVQLAAFELQRCLWFFFFSSRRRHTRSLCDWSSDVCSSDVGLGERLRRGLGQVCEIPLERAPAGGVEIDPARPARSPQEVRGMGTAVERPLGKAERAESATQITEAIG